MAKQLVNPIERHIEKVVVGIAGLLLVGVIARFVVTSPNKTQLGPETVTPGTIDSKVAQKAQAIQQRIAGASESFALPESLAPKFEKSLATIKAEPLPIAVALGPDVPVVDRVGTENKRTLVKVVPLKKPLLTWGRSTFKIGENYQPTNWVTVSSEIDVKAQMELQQQQYGAQRRDVIFGPFEIQRRARRPDGAWSDDEWKTVEAWPRVEPPRRPNVTLINDGGRVTVDKTMLSGLDNFLSDITKGQLQMELLRPLPPAIANGTPWTFPRFGKCEDVLRQDDEYLHANELPSATPEDRYGVCGPAAPATAAGTPVNRIAAELDAAEKMIKTAVDNLNDQQAVAAFNKAMEISTDATATPRDKERANALKKKAEQAQSDIIYRIRQGAGQPSAGQPKPGDTAKPVRERLPTQQAWALDAQPGSVASGRVYQYRMRANLLNRLLAESEKFADPADAAVFFVPGEWSEPSDPIAIPDDLEFYITGDTEKDEQINVEFFQWYGGVWVASKRAKFGIGDHMSAESRSPVPSIDDPNTGGTALVPFDSGETVVDVDFNRSQRERKKGTGKRGFKIGPPAKAVSVAYADADGNLFERWVPTDKGHPGKRAASERVWKPKSKQP